jgi:hypothetical protein
MRRRPRLGYAIFGIAIIVVALALADALANPTHDAGVNGKSLSRGQ